MSPRWWLLGLVVPLLGVAYLGLWPVPIEPVAWEPPSDRAHSGPHAVNTRLAQLERFPLDGFEGPEHVAVDEQGRLYTAVRSGEVLRIDLDAGTLDVVAKTRGRILGLEVGKEGRIYAADAYLGLLAIEPSGAIEIVADEANGVPIRYADAVTLAPDGLVYFTDASSRFGPEEFGGLMRASVLEMLEQRASGRVLVYDPRDGQVEEVARGLSFANGIVPSEDGERLLVVETGRYRVWSLPRAARGLDLSRPQNQAHRVIENLPGYPDNLTRGRDGRIWLGFVKPRSAIVDRLGPHPWLRKGIVRLPQATWPVPPPYGHVMAFTEDGRVVVDLQDPRGSYPETTGVTETGDRLVVHSLNAHELGWLRNP
ncbi:MAG: SMP-30/gluconolactonase/LRE family protein [Deltaproteobacteria bacterium]|nr:MAG: SMP-30/gluconolactonase/LRE family protein [Deltaproteobacteria bacterium]